MKRVLDFLASAALLVLLIPVGAAVTLCILTGDPGPVFFRQRRIGRDGRPFDLWKFRTMRAAATGVGAAITHGTRDPRISGIGYYLRMLKLDELPQLFNVLKGDMSFVGPRPEAEKYVALYDAEQRRVLDVRPGLTDIAVVGGHLHDAALLEGQPDPEKYYVEVVMPRKLRLNLYYVEHRSPGLDLRILFTTLMLLLGLRRERPWKPSTSFSG